MVDGGLAALVQRLDSTWVLVGHAALKGGVGAEVSRLDVDAGGVPLRLNVRAHGRADRSRNPNIARDEHRLLSLLHGKGLRVPRPFGLDVEYLDFPALIVEYIEGETRFDSPAATMIADAFAEFLLELHLLGARDFDFLPDRAALAEWVLDRRRETANDEFSESDVRGMLEEVWPPSSPNEHCVLHADLWPGNAIFANDRLVGVIDWEDACLGDPLADLANTRLELLAFFGPETRDRFTEAYLGRVGIDTTELRTWDLVSMLRQAAFVDYWGLDAATREKMRLAQRFAKAELRR